VPKKRLAAYRAKRDFAKTADPDGRARVVPSACRRFVVQKRAASRLHYDFRLELDGVFKSWAVTRGPSRDPTVKRLAVRLRTIRSLTATSKERSQKANGAGTVQLWDRGLLALGRAQEDLTEGRAQIHAQR
jgi:bifunctional non-homologous end joining protein LigD